jgi:DNA-binding NarL/FixJ family response regulator
MLTNDTSAAPKLTPREMVIVLLMSAGHSTPEIATQLRLRPRSVENRKRGIYFKLGVGSQSQAVARAIGLGLLHTAQPPSPGGQGTGRPQKTGEPGQAPLAILLGPPGPARDNVARMLIARRVPLVTAPSGEELRNDHWLSWHRGAMLAVLVDPGPADWAAAASLPAATVLISTGVPDRPALADALGRKATALVAKSDVTAGDLELALAVVAQGLLVMSWQYAEALLQWMSASPPTAPQLTARERDILGSIASGHSIRQTARTLGIATKTVENIQARLFRKLGARNRMDALTIADGWGLVERAVLPADLSGPAAHPLLRTGTTNLP